MTDPTKAQIMAVLKHLPTLKKQGFKPSQWRGGEKDENGIVTMPWEEHAEEVARLISALYKHGFVVEFDWPSWSDTARQYIEDPKRVAKADIETLKKLLTLHVRSDRFCGGHFTSMIENGHIIAILERLAAINGRSVRRSSK